MHALANPPIKIRHTPVGTTHKLHAAHIYNTRTASPRLRSNQVLQPGLHTFTDAGAGAGTGAAAGGTAGALETWNSVQNTMREKENSTSHTHTPP